MSNAEKEVAEIEGRYQRRDQHNNRSKSYGLLDSYTLSVVHERQWCFQKLFNTILHKSVNETSLLEIGCGEGRNLLEMLRFGFRPDLLAGNELLESRISTCMINLPQAVKFYAGDALNVSFDDKTFDIVFQSTVFTSILDREFQNKLAERMWKLVNPQGYVLWYDFTYDNPKNSDVKGVSLKRVKELFPSGEFHSKRITLAPPLGRRVCRIHRSLYAAFNSLPLLRSHVLCWVQKNRE